MIRLTPEQLVFVTERHLATLTTLRPDGTPHVVPVAFTWDAAAGVARVMSDRRSVKVGHARRPAGERPARAALCQVDGGRWLTLEGTLAVREDPAEIADAVARHTRRYTAPEEDPFRVVLRLAVDAVLSSSYMAM